MKGNNENKIKLSVLREFATKDESRYALSLPREVDGLMVATDGRVLVEVPVGEVDFEGEALEVLEVNFPDYRNIIDPAFRDRGDQLEGALELPPRPSKEEVTMQCWECRGEGYYPNGDACEDCDGEGSYEDLSEWTARLAGILLAGVYVERIVALPDVKWFAPRAPDGAEIGPVPFEFGSGGRGVLMPLRENVESSAAVARRAALRRSRQRRRDAMDLLAKVLDRERKDLVEERSGLSPLQLAGLVEGLAGLIAGRTLHEALGAPGDWGYGTAIGDALRELYKAGGGDQMLD